MPTYPGISSEAFKHPLDYQAETALRSVPGFDLLASNFVEYFHERPWQIYLLGNGIQVGPRQYSTLYGIFRECVRDLSLAIEPKLFVTQNPQANSFSLGRDHPSLVVHSGLLDLLNEAEIRATIAREIGHIKCDHGVFSQMAMWVMQATQLLGDVTFGLGNLLSSGLIVAFYEWRRKAELSADRAALLVMDDLDLVMRTMMKVAGGVQKYAHECSLEEVIRQSEEYQELDRDDLNQIYKFFAYNSDRGAFLSHSFSVERLYYLREWEQSEQYRQIRQGNYKNATQEGAVNVSTADSEDEIETLQRQIRDLEEKISRFKGRAASGRGDRKSQ